jgi:hypothetical protein
VSLLSAVETLAPLLSITLSAFANSRSAAVVAMAV